MSGFGSALASRAAAGAKCKLAPTQLRELATLLDAGPAAWRWDEDQCKSLARITEVVRRRFGVDYTLEGMDQLLHRIGWSVQDPARRAAERDEAWLPRGWKRPGRWQKDGGGPRPPAFWLASPPPPAVARPRPARHQPPPQDHVVSSLPPRLPKPQVNEHMDHRGKLRLVAAWYCSTTLAGMRPGQAHLGDGGFDREQSL